MCLQKALPELDYTRPPPIRSVTAPWLRRIWFSGSIPEGSDVGWSIDALESSASTVDEAYLDAVEQRVGPADRLAIIHTSGSTGAPKGVIHAHGSLLRTLNNINEIRAYGSDQVLFGTAPWFWVAGFSWSLLASFLAGARVSSLPTPPRRATFSISWNVSGRLSLSVMRRQSRAWRPIRLIPIGIFRPSGAEISGRSWHPSIRPRDPSLRHTIYGMTEVGGSITLCPDESDLPERLRGSGGQSPAGL
jgi:acyl-CoA synthetase (AMP-forming)/AMP-acid ligase II